MGKEIWQVGRLRFDPHTRREVPRKPRPQVALDHTLVAKAMTLRIARWEADTRELCFGGIRYSTKLDEFGVPILSDHSRSQLRAIID